MSVRLLFLSLWFLGLWGCAPETSSPVEVQDRTLPEFGTLVLDQDLLVIVHPGPRRALLEGERAVLDRLELQAENGRLRFVWKDAKPDIHRAVKVVLGLPALNRWEISGQAEGVLEDWKSGNLQVQVRDHGSFSTSLSDLKALDLDAADRAWCHLQGQSPSLNIKAKGLSDVDASEWAAGTLGAEVSDTASVSVWAQDTLQAYVIAHAHFTYRGSPKTLKVNRLGFAKVEHLPDPF